MISRYKNIAILILVFLLPESKAAENIYLYKGTFNRKIKVEELNKFQKTKKPSKKLKNLIKITNQNEENLYNLLSYEIDVPIIQSTKLMNSKIGEVFLSRISKIIHPNKISNKNIGIKALRSGIILGSFSNNERISIRKNLF